jgi:hypothetical protein
MLMKINNKPSLESLYLRTIKRQYIYSSIENSEAALGFERNDAGLKRLSQVLSGQRSDSSAFINAMSFEACTQLPEFSYFDMDLRGFIVLS